MIIRHVKIQNFRGIRCLDWNVRGRFVVLVGPGDAGKTSVFEAIDIALGRQWYAPCDADFYGGDPANEIRIDVTVGELPDRFLDLHGPGACVRGWNAGAIHDEPETGDEEVVTVRVAVDRALDPTWTLVTDRHSDGIHIKASDRAKLGLHRIGANVDHQLGWARGSLLTRRSDAGDALHGILAEAARKVRGSTDADGIPGIKTVVDETKRIAAQIGVGVDKLRAAINAADLTLGSALLSLHQRDIPVRQMGLGSRRLLAIGLELDSVVHGGIGLVDEVEHGLEPYRVHTLLHHIRSTTSGACGQMILTTHSADVVRDCPATALHVVRSVNGTMTISAVPSSDAMQAMIRTTPEALMARKVIVCEGKTEYGVCRGLDAAWTSPERPSFAARGCVPVNGGGNSKSAGFARELATLGYATCHFGDSDKIPNPSWTDLESSGIRVIRWQDTWSLEDVVFRTFPWAEVVRVLSMVAEEKGSTHLRDQATKCELTHVTNWLVAPEALADTTDIREALVKLAGGDRGCLKNIDIGDAIGRILAVRFKSLPAEDDVRRRLKDLRTWIDAT